MQTRIHLYTIINIESCANVGRRVYRDERVCSYLPLLKPLPEDLYLKFICTCIYIYIYTSETYSPASLEIKSNMQIANQNGENYSMIYRNCIKL